LYSISAFWSYCCGCQCVDEGLENEIPFFSPSLNVDVKPNNMRKLRIISDKNFFFQTLSQINDEIKIFKSLLLSHKREYTFLLFLEQQQDYSEIHSFIGPNANVSSGFGVANKTRKDKSNPKTVVSRFHSSGLNNGWHILPRKSIFG
jgi:hypothetical protein